MGVNTKQTKQLPPPPHHPLHHNLHYPRPHHSLALHHQQVRANQQPTTTDSVFYPGSVNKIYIQLKWFRTKQTTNLGSTRLIAGTMTGHSSHSPTSEQIETLFCFWSKPDLTSTSTSTPDLLHPHTERERIIKLERQQSLCNSLPALPCRVILFS